MPLSNAHFGSSKLPLLESNKADLWRLIDEIEQRNPQTSREAAQASSHGVYPEWHSFTQRVR